MSYTYAYPRASLTVDAVVFRRAPQKTELLLIQRGNEPFKGMWALPGGFLDMNETLEEAVQREVREETGLSGIDFRQLHAFSALDRDPRGRTVTVVFWGIFKDQIEAHPGDDAEKAQWFDLDTLPELAFDHADVIAMAIQTLDQLD
jgi:8-oxo-dGTP diphosphatase